MTVPIVPALHNSLANGLQNVKSKLNLDRGTHEELTTHARTHTHLTALCPGLLRSAGNREVKPIWILLKQELVSGTGISLATCKSAPHSRQITHQQPTTQCFTGRMPFLPPNQQHQRTEGKSTEELTKTL